MSTINTDKVLMPIIRNVMPQMIANHIVGIQPMTASTGEIFNVRHHYNRPRWVDNKTKYWPYRHEFDFFSQKGTVYEMERWCYTNIKSSNWRNFNNTFAFKREADYSAFLLRWT